MITPTLPARVGLVGYGVDRNIRADAATRLAGVHGLGEERLSVRSDYEGSDPHLEGTRQSIGFLRSMRKAAT